MPADNPSDDPSPKDRSDFESLGDEQHLSLFAEFCWFLRENKKWWLIPILLVLAAVGVLLALAATGAAPFLYPFH